MVVVKFHGRGAPLGSIFVHVRSGSLRYKVAEERLLRNLSSLSVFDSLSRTEYVVLPREEGTCLDTLYEPLWPNHLHVLELANLRRREGASDDVGH